jgi:hypothetical protein
MNDTGETPYILWPGKVKNVCNASTQTDGLKRARIANGFLLKYANYIDVNYPWLQYGLHTYGKYHEHHSLDISRVKADILPSQGGPLSIAHVILLDNGVLKLTICGKDMLVTSIELGASGTGVLQTYLENLGESYVFCKGIAHDEYSSVCTNIPYVSKGVTKVEYPFPRYVSKKCQTWYKLRKNATLAEHQFVVDGTNRCSECNTSYRYLRKLQKQEVNKLSNLRKKRTQVSSKYPISLLPPPEKKKRISNLKQARKNSEAKLQRLHKKMEGYTITVDDEQSSELVEFLDKHVTVEKVQHVLEHSENFSNEGSHAMKEAFFKDQQRNSK